MSLPTIPADITPAPRPEDPSTAGMSSGYLGAWQDSPAGLRWAAYRAGPAAYASAVEDGEQVYELIFPTFGKHPEQTRILMAAGYRWDGRRWRKAHRGTAGLSAERQWALALYRALHPTWVPL